MHYHLEVILPPAADVEAAISQIMAPFSENADEDESNGHSFWDWYVIGGRWAGSKQNAAIGEEKLQAFRDELVRRKVTVSSFQAGKQSLEPKSQIEMVDALWRDYFPDSGMTSCPLFDHSNDQYSNDQLTGDTCELSRLPSELKASMVIIAGPHYSDADKLVASYITQQEIWNGVNHERTAWDSKVSSAIDAYRKKIESYKDEYKQKHMPLDNWLVVTVDYHS